VRVDLLTILLMSHGESRNCERPAGWKDEAVGCGCDEAKNFEKAGRVLSFMNGRKSGSQAIWETFQRILRPWRKAANVGPDITCLGFRLKLGKESKSGRKCSRAC
jgi:hypothetical protein